MRIVVEGKEHLPHQCRDLLWGMEWDRKKAGLPPLLVGTVVECDCGAWHMISMDKPYRFHRWASCAVSRPAMWVLLSARQKRRVVEGLPG